MLLQLVRSLDQGPPEPWASGGAVSGLAARAAGCRDQAGVAAEPVAYVLAPFSTIFHGVSLVPWVTEALPTLEMRIWAWES